MQINKPENTLQNISVGNKEINAARVPSSYQASSFPLGHR